MVLRDCNYVWETIKMSARLSLTQLESQSERDSWVASVGVGKGVLVLI